MITPIKVNEAKAALSLFLDDAGIPNAADRHNALNCQIAATWFEYLKRAGLAEGLDVFDVVAGKDALITELVAQMPTGAGKTNPALVLERPAMAQLQQTTER